MPKTTSEIPDVVLLCGGQGTRLRSVVSDRPKSLALIGGVPFLDILLQSLANSGFRRIVIGVGYLREQIAEHVKNSNFPLEVVIAPEIEPLGTGGGARNALQSVHTDHFIVMNGDSLCKVNFNALREFHVNKNAIMSMVLAPVPEGELSYGVVTTKEDGNIINFREKPSGVERGMVSAGIYMMRGDIRHYFPEHQKVFSLEYDLFPKILPYGCYGFLAESNHIDIGTPERYARANQFAEEIKNWYSPA